MRLVMIGSGSYIAGHVARAAVDAGIDVLPLRHDANVLDELHEVDVVVNFALHPDFQSAPYTEGNDLDLRAARAARKHNARFVMLSTRRVYPSAARWGAKESGVAGGDETTYGQNKAVSENAVRAIGQDLTILRLSNVVGFEYALSSSRKTFMAMLLQRLRAEREISFDMHPSTGRDFLPVEMCAHAIVCIIKAGMNGVFNVGCGFAVPCGDVANAVLRGFGKGKLVVTNNEIRDAFYLDTSRWNSSFAALVSPAALIDYCQDLGRRLKNA